MGRPWPYCGQIQIGREEGGKPVRREITVLENVLRAGVQTPRFVGGMWVSRPPQAAVHPPDCR